MKREKNLIHVLLVDDKIDYAETFKKLAIDQGIQVRHARSLEEMKKMLPSIAKLIASIVLDIKGLIDLNQEFDDENFLAASISYLDSEYKLIPRFVITADKGRRETFSKFFSNETIYSKDDVNDLFKSIKEQAYHLESYKIRNKFRDIFKFLSSTDYTPDICEKLNVVEQGTLELLKNYKENDPILVCNNLGLIRRMVETLIQIMNLFDRKLMPNDCFDPYHMNVIFEKVDTQIRVKRVADSFLFPTIIRQTFEMLWKLSSEDGNHVPYEKSELPPSKYTVQSLTFALLDLMRLVKIKMT
jgi:hypothetical protein